MNKVKSDILHVKGINVGIYTEDYRNEYISLTDIARFRNSDDPRFAIQNWMRNRNTLEFLGLWESLHNPNFNRVQFDTFRTEAGLNRFVMTPSKWIDSTGAIGLVTKAGRYNSGTYAHSDIAMEFASWISAEFKLYLMKDYRRLKLDENSRLSLSWNLNREISKLNYRVHTDAIQQNLLPPDLTKELVLANMESYNALLISQKMAQSERLKALRIMAVNQLQTLSALDVTHLPQLSSGTK